MVSGNRGGTAGKNIIPSLTGTGIFFVSRGQVAIAGLIGELEL